MKIEIVNLPFLEGHKVSTAKVKIIEAKELQEGEVILFGRCLEKVEKIHTIAPNISIELKSLSKKESEKKCPTCQTVLVVQQKDNVKLEWTCPNCKAVIVGVKQDTILKLNLPMGALFHRVLEANYGNGKTSFPNWQRLRKPIIDEEIICEACGGTTGKVDEDFLKRFEEERNTHPSGNLGHDAEMDFFQGYDGCEG